MYGLDELCTVNSIDRREYTSWKDTELKKLCDGLSFSKFYNNNTFRNVREKKVEKCGYPQKTSSLRACLLCVKSLFHFQKT